MMFLSRKACAASAVRPTPSSSRSQNSAERCRIDSYSFADSIFITIFAGQIVNQNQKMPTKIRLQRKGKKGQPYYHIVIADGRAPREGRFIEKIGVYNPLLKPAEIEISFDKALGWLQNGAQPTDTVRAILSYKGVLYKYHLLKGVQKGALTLEQAEVKFQTWLSEKEAKIQSVRKEQELNLKDSLKKQREDETRVNEVKAQAIAKKLAKLQAKEAEASAEAEVVAQAEASAEAEVVAEAEAPAAETDGNTATEESPSAEPKQE
jgi:small subunit ribosomal protein S16